MERSVSTEFSGVHILSSTSISTVMYCTVPVSGTLSTCVQGAYNTNSELHCASLLIYRYSK